MHNTLRYKTILALLEKSYSLTINELVVHLNVSPNTVRNDVNKLAQEGKLLKVHGGAMIYNALYSYPTRTITIKDRLHTQLLQKRKIAQLVINNLPQENHISLFMDSSTTVFEIAKALYYHPYKITIVTNFLEIANILKNAPNITVYILGGRVWDEEDCTIGELVLNNIKQYHTSISLVGSEFINFYNTEINSVEIEMSEIKLTMSQHSLETWLCVDQTKFGKNPLTKNTSSQNNKIHTIVTDQEPSIFIKNILKKNKINLLF